MGKSSIIGRTDWNQIMNRIGTFNVTGGGANTIRYTYSGTSNATNPPRVENAQKQVTPSAEDPLASATITTPTGYFAVKSSAGGAAVYTRDTQLSIQQYEGRWVLGSSNGDIMLDDKLQEIPILFIPTNDDINVDNAQRNAEGQFAVRGANGTPEFRTIAEDGFRAAQDPTSGRWYITNTDGEYLLDTTNSRMEIKFAQGNYFSLDWQNAADKVGVFAVPENELSTTDRTRYDAQATVNNNIGKLLESEGPGGIRLNDKDGFYALETANGIRYARNAKLDIMQGDDGAWYLSTTEGEYVLDANNNRIVVSEPMFTGNVDWVGVRDAVGVFVFPNPYGIEALGSNRYLETDKSGAAVADRNMEKLQYALIASNVELSDMMVKLIETQRSYQLSSRVVTTSDELAQISNNLR